MVCEADNDSGGDITGVTAGTGLSGGAVTGNATVSVDTTVIQSRVSSSCPSGQSIRVINANGTVTCEADTDTTIPNTTKSGWWRYDFEGGYGFPTESGTTYVTAGVHLPNGVAVTSVACYVMDNNSMYDLTLYDFDLRRAAIGSNSDTIMAHVSGSTTGQSSTIQNITDTSISVSVINNSAYYYFMTVNMAASFGYSATTSSSIRLRGCRILTASDSYFIMGR